MGDIVVLILQVLVLAMVIAIVPMGLILGLNMLGLGPISLSLETWGGAAIVLFVLWAAG